MSTENVTPEEIKKINKRGFTKRVAERMNIPSYLVRGVYDAFWEEMEDLLTQGYTVVLNGHGTFTAKKRKGLPSRSTSNDGTKNDSLLPTEDYYSVNFKPAEIWRERVRKGRIAHEEGRPVILDPETDKDE